jgi:hypothetical protein
MVMMMNDNNDMPGWLVMMMTTGRRRLPVVRRGRPVLLLLYDITLAMHDFISADWPDSALSI